MNKIPNKMNSNEYNLITNMGMWDIITDSLQIEVLAESKTYRFDLDKGWFITTPTTWQCTVDKFGRAGTSQCFAVLRFEIEGQRFDGNCYPIGLRVHAKDKLGRSWLVPHKVLSIDSEASQEEPTTDTEPKFDMDVEDKIKYAKKLIRTICARNNYSLAFSGGKDSVVLHWLTKIAGVQAPLVYNNTTIDPPGTISFCRRMGAQINQPRFTFLQLVEKKGYPTMFRRFCCEELKERYIADYLLTGVRKSESVKRNKRYCAFEDSYRYNKHQTTNRLHPLLYFTNEDIEYICNTYQLENHPLYYDEQGVFHVERRLGCIGCPLQGDRGVSDFKRYPNMLKRIIEAGNKFHRDHGRDKTYSYENLVYNFFYSKSDYSKYQSAFQGLFPTDAKAILEKEFNITLP